MLDRIRRPDDVWQAADAFADPALREASATVRTFEIKSLLAVAIPYEGRAIGALYVDDLHRADRRPEAPPSLGGCLTGRCLAGRCPAGRCFAAPAFRAGIAAGADG